MQANGVAGAAAQLQTVPELGHLKAAADRLSQVNFNLTSFYHRFYGPMQEGTGDAKKDEMPCYRNDITAVLEQISRLEEMVNNLQNIG